jgi:hypothetical protein
MTEPMRRRQRRKTLTDRMVSELQRQALRKLAALIERIVNPPANNVIPLHEAAAS